MPARMEESLAGLSRKGEEAIFTTTCANTVSVVQENFVFTLTETQSLS
jgi:hypothetical protein